MKKKRLRIYQRI